MDQAIQMVGAMIVLSGFIANQRFGLSSDSVWFLLANFVGTSILAVCAAVNRDAGFTLVEGVWAIVSLLGLVRALRRGTPARPAPA
ncbi:MAG: CBU_0592 family membrane protein [Sporichthyaceae bacterium]